MSLSAGPVGGIYILSAHRGLLVCRGNVNIFPGLGAILQLGGPTKKNAFPQKKKGGVIGEIVRASDI